jgi:hypothetical protein
LQSRWAALVQPAPKLVDLTSADVSAMTTVPPGVVASVTGALAR